MADPSIAEKTEQWRDVGKEFFAGGIESVITSEFGKVLSTSIGDIIGVILATAYTALAPIGTGLAKGMTQAEDYIAPAFADFAAHGVNDVFGTNLSGSAFAQAKGGASRTAGGEALGRALMDQMRGTAGALAPSDEAAAKYVAAMAGAAIEDWFKGWFFEVMTSLVPQLDVGKIENYGALGDKVSSILGLSGVSRRVFRPIVDATIVTPLEWKTNITYRPNLLSAGEVARQVARGRWTREQGIEELARQGYSDVRIEALLNAQRKFFSPSDVRQFVTREHWSRDAGLAHLRDQGYEPDAANDALRLEGLKRIEQLEGQQAGAIINAYVDGRIDRVTFGGMLSDVVSVASERALLTELAEVRRAVNVKGLSPAEAKACVKAKILSVRDYREALEQDGYEPDAVTALELLLRHELEEQAAIETLREQQAADRLAEKTARDEARATRKLEIEAERELAKRGTESDLEAAAVRGLIPFSRVAEVYAATYDGDTVALLLDLLEDRRLAYVEQQLRREDALQRGRRKNINAGDVEQAFMAKVLSPADLRRRLEQIGFDAADAELLTVTAVARLAEKDAAERRRTEAEKRASQRSIDLGRFERLVRRGARTLAQYDQLLASLGFDEAARAGMSELLALTMADDARARELRATEEPRLASRGLSLEQARRGVLLGVTTVADFEQFLIREGFTTDAQLVLLADVRAALEDAEAARRRRAEEASRVEARELPLGTVRRAARLGIVSPDVYLARLRADSFSEEDVELELELLLLEIADVQAARARRDAAEQDAATRGLSLADVERAVKAGVRSIEDYRARAAQLGYTAAAVDDLVALLGVELAQLADARARKQTIVSELATRNLSIGQLEEAVTKGFKTLEEFVADVRALGYGADDAELLAGLLAVDLEATAAAG